MLQPRRRNGKGGGRQIDMLQNTWGQGHADGGKGKGRNRPMGSKGGRQGGVARGTAAHIKLNKDICDAAERWGAEGILQIVGTNIQWMSFVNLSSALHRLSTAKDDCNLLLGGDPRFEALCSRTTNELERQVVACDESAPRCWSTIAWSYAKLQHAVSGVEHVLSMIAAVAEPKVTQFKPFELTNLLWAFAKTKTYNDPLFDSSRRHIEDNIHAFSRSSLSTLAWVYATADFPAQRLLQALAMNFIAKLSGGEIYPVELSNLIWGLATAQIQMKYTAYKSIGNAALDILSTFKLHELSIFLWAFSRVGVRHDDVFNRSADLLANSPEWQAQMHPQGIANILWAFAKQVEFGSSATQTLVRTFHALLPLATRLLPQMKPKELSCVIWAATKLGCYGEMRAHTDSLFAALAQMPNAWFAQLSLAHRIQFLRDTVAVADNLDMVSQSQSRVHRRFAGLCTERLGEIEPWHLADLLELPNNKPIVGRLPELSTLFADAAGATVKSIDLFDRPLLGRLAGAVPNLPGDLQPSLTGAIAHRLHQVGIDECPPQDKMHIAAMCGLDFTNIEQLPATLASFSSWHLGFAGMDPEPTDRDVAAFYSDDEFFENLQPVSLLVQTSFASASRPPAALEPVPLTNPLMNDEENNALRRSTWKVKNTFVELTGQSDEMSSLRLNASRFRSA